MTVAPTGDAPRLTTAFVQTDKSCDPIGWQARNQLDSVPDRLPYGLNRLSEFGIEPHHLVPRQGAVARSAARSLRVAGFRYDWWNALSARSVEVDAYVCWDEKSGVPTRLVAPLIGPPVATGVIWLTDARRTSAQVQVAVRALRRTEAVWALSTAQLPVLREMGVAAKRLHFLPFGIDEGFWTASRVVAEPDADPTGEPTVPTILAVGNDRDRDHETLLKAVAPLCRRGLARLRLVTSQELSIPPEVGVRLPVVPHAVLRAEYAAAAVVCVALRPNLHVSGMTTLLEAQALGTPVVATRTPGMEDYVIDGETGRLVEHGDPDAFQAAVAGLLADPEEATAMGRRGRQLVEERANTRHQAARLAEIIHAIT